MRSARRAFGAVGEVLAVDVQRAAPLAVEVAVEPEIEAGPEMEPGVADRLEGDRPLGAVGVVKWNVPPSTRRLTGSKRTLGPQRHEPLDPAVGVLDTALDRRLLVAAEPELAVLVVQRVARAVGALEEHRAPREPERRHHRHAALEVRVGRRRPTPWRTPHEWSRVENQASVVISWRTPSTSTQPVPTPVWW